MNKPQYEIQLYHDYDTGKVSGIQVFDDQIKEVVCCLFGEELQNFVKELLRSGIEAFE